MPERRNPSAPPVKRASLLQRLLHRGRMGRFGETLAAKHLRRQRYRIVARNVTMQHGELDVVALRDDVLAIVEVRTRRAGAPQSPEASVDRTKQQHLLRAATEFIARRGLRNLHIRFDVIAIELDARWNVVRFDHYERAFDPPRR